MNTSKHCTAGETKMSALILIVVTLVGFKIGQGVIRLGRSLKIRGFASV